MIWHLEAEEVGAVLIHFLAHLALHLRGVLRLKQSHLRPGSVLFVPGERAIPIDSAPAETIPFPLQSVPGE